MSSTRQWTLRTVEGIEYYELADAPGVLIAFTTRKGGVSRDVFSSLNLSSEVGDQGAALQQNLERVKRALRVPVLLTLRQTHSDLVLPIFYSRVPSDLLEGDACLTNLPNLGLGIKVADCLPVFMYSFHPVGIGIAHCGWRGTASRIAEKLARQMCRRFSVPLTDLRFAFGPCICPDCYSVGEDVVSEFREHFPAAEKFFSPARPNQKSSRYRLDIRTANRWLLKQMGLVEAGSLDLCTRENMEQFYSARSEQPTGRNLAVIALR